jgi:NADH:ubiquinone oxidoreductase subunit 6 (subunit J)
MNLAVPSQLTAVIVFGLGALGCAIAVFRTRSMVRSALFLLGAAALVGMIFLALQAEFLGVLQLMMMATELSVMAAFMVMFMMDPGGMGQMDMTHQKGAATAAGVVAALCCGLTCFITDWGPLNAMAPDAPTQNHALGLELMERSMMIFETAGATILLAMVAATSAAIRRRG